MMYPWALLGAQTWVGRCRNLRDVSVNPGLEGGGSWSFSPPATPQKTASPSGRSLDIALIMTVGRAAGLDFNDPFDEGTKELRDPSKVMLRKKCN